ncbi:MAG: hypothetical protein H7329_17145 [Opitutaceae bacterium]|nr:hypothetical protein [Cytophagales bacterium]
MENSFLNRDEKLAITLYYDFHEDYQVKIGIGKEHLPKVFQMVKSLHNRVEGTGMELYIIKRIMVNN